MLESYCSKFGITSSLIIRTTEELRQQLNIHGGGTCTSLKMSASCEMVTLIDLAATKCGHHIDKALAVKLSGLGKRQYLNTLKAAENLLGLQEVYTIKELAVQFGCTTAVSLAQQALDRYVSVFNEKSCDQMDFTSPLFQTAALCAACRKLKVKVDRVKLFDVSGVKKTTYDKLVSELDVHITDIIGAQKATKLKRPKSFLEELENSFQEEDQAIAIKHKRSEENKDEKPDFSEWKRKILERAGRSPLPT